MKGEQPPAAWAAGGTRRPSTLLPGVDVQVATAAAAGATTPWECAAGSDEVLLHRDADRDCRLTHLTRVMHDDLEFRRPARRIGVQVLLHGGHAFRVQVRPRLHELVG